MQERLGNPGKVNAKFPLMKKLLNNVALIGYLKGRLGLPSLKRLYSERELGKYSSEVK
jgi:hypothetical protein